MTSGFTTSAVVLESPGHLRLSDLDLSEPQPDDVVVAAEWSGISTGTERLLWSGRMPDFPGMGYPLVPGYETIGRVFDAGSNVKNRIGERVFVPGANCYGPVRGLFGGASARIVLPSTRAPSIGEKTAEEGVLMALAATAHHAICQPDTQPPELIVGHGVLGRLMARLTIALTGQVPTVWERDASRTMGSTEYRVVAPENDDRRHYRSIIDASGDADILDSLVGRLAKHGQITLAGFYDKSLHFAFPPAFMREARIFISAEWQPADLEAVIKLVEEGQVSLQGLITHRESAKEADYAYRTAFGDPNCLKMVLDWRDLT
ncbi:MAG: chlorophyll synthesis pathway protein BchC [Pseudomonadota bacterium]